MSLVWTKEVSQPVPYRRQRRAHRCELRAEAAGYQLLTCSGSQQREGGKCCSCGQCPGVPSLSPQPKEKEESAEYFRILKLSLGTEVGNEEKTVCGQRNEPSSLKKLDFMLKPIE